MHHRLPFVVILYVLLSSLTLSYAQKTVGSLTVQGTKKCIDNNNGLSNGALQTIQTCNPSSQTQSWNFINSNVAGKQLLQSSNGYCLDVPGGKGVNGQRLQIWQCSPSNKNQFFSQVGSQIVWNGSKMCLNIRNGQKTGFASGAFLQLYQCNTANPNSNIRLITTPSTVTSTSKPSNSPTSSAFTTPTTSTPSPSSSANLPSSSPNSPSSNSTLNRYGKPGLTAVFDQTRKRMLAWGYDDSQAPMMAAGRKIGSYYHWENDVIPNMPVNVPYIPMYWGVSKTTQWNEVKNTIGNISVPGAVFGFNEPDVSTQANMDPISAANLYYNQITQVYGVKGSNLISPPIVWNVDGWLVPFMNACNTLGCGISAIGYHQYIDLQKDAGGSVDNAIALLQSRITSLYQKYNMPIILNELGLTQAGGGTAQQLNDFMVKSGHFLDNSPMVLAWALSAVFAQGSGWDGYLNSNLAFFNQNGTLSALGSSYMNDDF